MNIQRIRHIIDETRAEAQSLGEGWQKRYATRFADALEAICEQFDFDHLQHGAELIAAAQSMAADEPATPAKTGKER